MRRTTDIALHAIVISLILCAIAGCSSTKVEDTQSQDNSQQKPQSRSERTPNDSTNNLRHIDSAKTLPPVDSTKASHRPRLRFSPPVLITAPDSTGFVTARIYIHNDGGGTLTMTEVKGSCGCAGASVQRNRISGSDSGMIYLQINPKSFTEPTNNVDFTVKSNAENSPTVFRAVINIRK